MLDMSVVPWRFVLDPEGREVTLRKDTIIGFASPDYEGAPCIKILAGNRTLFVLGPAETVRRKLGQRPDGR